MFGLLCRVLLYIDHMSDVRELLISVVIKREKLGASAHPGFLKSGWAERHRECRTHEANCGGSLTRNFQTGTQKRVPRHFSEQ